MGFGRLRPEWTGENITDGKVIIEMPVNPSEPEADKKHKSWYIKLTDWLGTLNHAALTSNLDWTNSGHTGTALKYAGFDANGLATELDGGTSIADILDIPTSETDDTLVLAPDGSGGVEWRAESGGSTVIPYFDATIGTGGDYATFNLAYADGKRSLKVVGNTSLSADITIDNCYVYLDDFTLACDTYNFTINEGKVLTIEGIGTITFSYGIDKKLLLGNSNVTGSGNMTKSLTITNTSTVNEARISDKGVFRNIIVNAPNRLYCGFGSSTGLGVFSGVLDTIKIVSGGTSCIPIMASSSNEGSVSNIRIIGNMNYVIIERASNIYHSGTGSIRLYYGTNIFTTGSIYALGYVTNFNCNSILDVTNQSLTNGRITGAVSITTNAVKFNRVDFSSTLTISGDNCKLNSSNVTGLLTLSAGAEYNDISHNTLTGGLTNNSGNTTNIIQANI